MSFVRRMCVRPATSPWDTRNGSTSAALSQHGILPTVQSRGSDRMALAIQEQCDIPVTLWDESFSTQIARQARIEMGTKRRKRSGHLDELAATVILQSYLDSKLSE